MASEALGREEGMNVAIEVDERARLGVAERGCERESQKLLNSEVTCDLVGPEV